MLNKITTIKILLYAGSLYFIIGAVVHFFGFSLFPFYDGKLYAPYHDTVIALSAIVLSLVLFATAKNPIKNEDILNVIILGGIIAIIFSVWIILKIDFQYLGSPDKGFQTIFEMVLLVFYTASLIYLKPKK